MRVLNLFDVLCWVQTLAELQDRLQPFPTDIALQLIEEELGEPASAILSEITPEPVAAASLGQVPSQQCIPACQPLFPVPCSFHHSVGMASLTKAAPPLSTDGQQEPSGVCRFMTGTSWRQANLCHYSSAMLNMPRDVAYKCYHARTLMQAGSPLTSEL